MAPDTKLRVAFFNPIIAHYRQGLLRELRASKHCQYFLFADLEDSVDAIPTLDLSRDHAFVRTRCTRFARFTWQHGVVGAAFGNYDVYIFLGSAEWLSSWLGALIARLRGRRVLFWTHGWTRHDSPLKRRVRNTLYRFAHGLLLYGDRARTIGIGYGFQAANLYVMYNSLDFDSQRAIASRITATAARELRRELFGDAETPVVIGSARLTKAKRFDLLIHALALLARRGRPVHLLLVGDGPERMALQALAIDQEVNAVLIGACYDEQWLARYFSCANVTASPGNIGLTCMHSLGYGVPVITHDDPENQGPEWEAIAPGISGTLFKRDNIESLAAAIDEWTNTSFVDEQTQARCIASIAARYHPVKQHKMIEMAVLGSAAAALEFPKQNAAPTR